MPQRSRTESSFPEGNGAATGGKERGPWPPVRATSTPVRRDPPDQGRIDDVVRHGEMSPSST
jgi:hypothetical protein